MLNPTYVSVFELIKFGGTISSHHKKIAISDSVSHVSAYKCCPDTVLTVVVRVTFRMDKRKYTTPPVRATRGQRIVTLKSE